MTSYENIDEIEETLFSDFNIGGDIEDNGENIDGYFSDDEYGDDQFEIFVESDLEEDDFAENEDIGGDDEAQNGNGKFFGGIIAFVRNLTRFLSFLRCLFCLQRRDTLEKRGATFASTFASTCNFPMPKRWCSAIHEGNAYGGHIH